MPRFYVLNKLDRENVSFDKVYQELRERFGKKLTIAHIPLESGVNFYSVVDILRKKMYTYAHDGSGKVTEEDIPENIAGRVDELRNELIESVAESDDELLEKYFEAGELTEEELISGFKNAIKTQMVVPIVCASASNNVGISNLIDFIVTYLPTPNEMPPIQSEDGKERNSSDNEALSALVFKTVAEAHVGELSYVRVFSGVLKPGAEALNPNQDKTERIGQMFVLNGKHKKNVDSLHAGDIGALVKLKTTHTGDTLCSKGDSFKISPIEFPEPLISIAVLPQTKGDEDKIATGLHILHEEDPTFIANYNPELKQTIVSGQGELHLNIILKRLSQRF
ncbi:MAG: elongation factor G, partial [Calditrichae bacterium]|nr:elongation factor G [Calditrichia bacterium]NIW80115.1 elongation factor G [Calditrichia bacterium]